MVQSSSSLSHDPIYCFILPSNPGVSHPLGSHIQLSNPRRKIPAVCLGKKPQPNDRMAFSEDTLTWLREALPRRVSDGYFYRPEPWEGSCKQLSNSVLLPHEMNFFSAQVGLFALGHGNEHDPIYLSYTDSLICRVYVPRASLNPLTPIQIGVPGLVKVTWDAEPQASSFSPRHPVGE